jgi:hypothetical protein
MSDMESHHSINLDDVGGLLDSKDEREEEEHMDQTEPTGTAAIPQNQVVFYNDPNSSVQEQPQVDQQAAILPAVNAGEEQPNPETTSQNMTN